MTTRRAAQRDRTRDDIKHIARQQMAEVGAAGLSLNAIARQMGVAVSGLYRYYDSRDALVTALIIDAFHAQAAAMQAGADAPPRNAYQARMMGAMWGYRSWAVAHPAEFALIYGSPIPGYVAPADQTRPAAARAMTVVYEVLNEAEAMGKLHAPADLPMPPKLLRETGVSLQVAYLGAVGWTRIHGHVTLEVFGHLDGLVTDLEAFYRAECATLMREGGLQPD